MGQFRFLTAGESHGKGLTMIIEGLPSGLPLAESDISPDLGRRQGGYGRGGRMKIEKDHAEITAGVRHGYTLGSPVSMWVQNRDWVNWTEKMAIEPVETEIERVTRLRPGHADMPGIVKYGFDDVRNILERASARETTARVAVGAVAKRLLAEFGVVFRSHTISIAGVHADVPPVIDWEAVEADPVRCSDSASGQRMVDAINAAKPDGDTVGGEVEVRVSGIPIGLGSHVHWDRKLDGRIAQAICSINAFKAVGFGLGFAATGMRGSQVHDVILPVSEWRGQAWRHQSNNHGGIEGGMSTGEEIVVRAAVKPIPTLAHPLPSVDLDSGEEVLAHYERSDVCVVPAGGVVAEAMVAIVLADAWMEKFGGDTLPESRANYEHYLSTIGPRARAD
ncbi:MAG: chorismate synthase [Dehalococcoidia bacterium]|jgi:chorismate synthase|uniref:chorismate synthase n=1 Tax=Candidatus Amarobacter glycogenicus TaxID=3140699 RepID=UPI0031359A04|nr:chorismate synthase [Dehalococcoidia bacterium]MBK7125065.1 chorismate synthase [Dehalococcoidia bacterium]MBK8559674.1 chorismate synthase [Dehalococcoidia bacterium]